MAKKNNDKLKRGKGEQQSPQFSKRQLIKGANIVVGSAAAISMLASGCTQKITTTPTTTTTTTSLTTVTTSLSTSTAINTTTPTIIEEGKEYLQYLYSTDHIWVKVESNNRVRLGITSYYKETLAAEVLTIAFSVEVGSEIARDNEFANLVSEKINVTLLSPVSGVVVEINGNEMYNDAASVQSDPYGRGWFIVIELSHPEELKSLISADEYFRRYE
jgi:glycine cleavage system H protein